MQKKSLASSETLNGIKNCIVNYLFESDINLSRIGLPDSYEDICAVLELVQSDSNKYRLKYKSNYLDLFTVEFKYRQHGPRYFFKRVY